MDETERWVRTWMASNRDEEVEATVAGIVNGRNSLLNVVKALGEYLTSEEDDVRSKALEFLALVIKKCPETTINRQATRTLVTFLCGKLDDPETVIPALKGLTSLVRLPTCTDVDAVDTVNAIFADVRTKGLDQAARFLVFSIFDTLLANHRSALQGVGKPFVAQYITIAEGEKDPRNLLLAFAIARVIIIEFDISELVESMFNITFCYFPISFRPPPDYEHAVSADDLKKALRGCLNASPSFGPLAIPLFLEKLMAGSPATKRDTLQTMSFCLPVYGSSLARNLARKLWNSLKLEIFQSTDPVTEGEALNALTVLVNTIYSCDDHAFPNDESSSPDEIQGLAKDVCVECVEILHEPEKSLARPANKVICAFLATTPSIARFALAQTIPHFIKVFKDTDEISNRPNVLALLSELLAAFRDSILTAESSDLISLEPYKDEVLGIFTAGLKTLSTRLPATEGLKVMVNIKDLLSDEELGFIVLHVDEILQNDEEEADNEVSDQILNLLTMISSLNARHVREQTLPLLFSSLPDFPPGREAVAERSKCFRILAALEKLCLQAELFETLVIRILTKLDLMCIPTKQVDTVDNEPAIAYAHALLSTLAKTLEKKVDDGHVDVPKYIDRLVPGLLNLFIWSCLTSADENPTTDVRVIQIAATMVTLVNRTLAVEKQTTFVASCFSAYFQNQPILIAKGHQPIPSDSHFAPFDPSAPTLQRNLAIIFCAAIVPLRKEIVIPNMDTTEFMTTLTSWAVMSAQNVAQISAATNAVSAVINKRSDDAAGYLDFLSESFWLDEVANPEHEVERRCRSLLLWSAVCRALLSRGHPRAESFWKRLFDLFDDAAVSWPAARAIGEIANSGPTLKKKNYAVLKLLYAQKFFHQVLPIIMQGTQGYTGTDVQTAHLVALASLIKAIPRDTYATKMAELLPLLLRGLELQDYEIRANVISTFQSTADALTPQTTSNAIAEHASTLVATMLRNCLFRDVPSVTVRKSALRYLATLPKIVRYDVLHPHRVTVLKQLAAVLDDPKRSVRKEAVDARSSWFIMSAK